MIETSKGRGQTFRETSAHGSERHEPGCLRFNVFQDAQDQNLCYFFEVYWDEAAPGAHRAAPTTPSGARPRGQAGRRPPGDALSSSTRAPANQRLASRKIRQSRKTFLCATAPSRCMS